MDRRRPRIKPTARRSGAALYTSVLAVALLVSVLALTALKVYHVERQGALVQVDAASARANARSAVELALQDIWTDSGWRARYTHNVETSLVTFGAGTLSWRLKDTADSSLSDNPSDAVEILGIGRVGNAAWVESVSVQPVEREIGPIELRAYTDASDLSSDVVNSSKAWAQTFRPYLPANASSWRVTTVDFYAQREGTVSGSTAVSLYVANANNRPGSTLVDQVVVAESALSSSLSWTRVNFTGTTALSPTSALSLAFTTSSGTPMRLAIDADGVDATNTWLVAGNPAWQSTFSTASLLFRVTGMYRVRELQVVSGSWRRAPLP